ncbi:MAG: hypothetical protein ABI480_14105 [Chitinophagaceae bacterium]
MFIFIIPGLLFYFSTGKGYGILIVFPAIGVLIFLVYIWSFKLIAIGTDFIRIQGLFSKKIIPLTDISVIDLLSKDTLPLSFDQVISTKITKEDGKTIIIYDIFYRNIAELKQTMADRFGEKIKPFKKRIHKSTLSDISPEPRVKFAGNPYLTFNTFIILFFLFLLITGERSIPSSAPLWRHYFLLPISLIFIAAIGTQTHYFILENEKFIVKNHIFFWMNRVYPIEDILGVNKEYWHKRSLALRITTIDFKSNRYPAGSLGKKTWERLMNTFKALDVHVIGKQ